ncbi:MAG: hypothetical protein L3V56_03105 [Candidatus Magnetoovum sp. WYHC-5]|nr:hypothetical protein [Candidatus Magnetoovum sp. WYHC-5]
MEVLTFETTEQEKQIYNDKVEVIKEALKELSPPLIDSLHEYVTFLLEKEKRHRAFVKETLDAAADPDYLEFDSVEEAMEAIRNWSE